jgi:hypothetical protein
LLTVEPREDERSKRRNNMTGNLFYGKERHAGEPGALVADNLASQLR